MSTDFDSSNCRLGGFRKLGIPFWGVPIIRLKIFWGQYWGPVILGNYLLVGEYATCGAVLRGQNCRHD